MLTVTQPRSGRAGTGTLELPDTSYEYHEYKGLRYKMPRSASALC